MNLRFAGRTVSVHRLGQSGRDRLGDLKMPTTVLDDLLLLLGQDEASAPDVAGDGYGGGFSRLAPHRVLPVTAQMGRKLPA